jgi:hypothetical protein
MRWVCAGPVPNLKAASKDKPGPTQGHATWSSSLPVLPVVRNYQADCVAPGAAGDATIDAMTGKTQRSFYSLFKQINFNANRSARGLLVGYRIAEMAHQKEYPFELASLQQRDIISRRYRIRGYDVTKIADLKLRGTISCVNGRRNDASTDQRTANLKIAKLISC